MGGIGGAQMGGMGQMGVPNNNTGRFTDWIEVIDLDNRSRIDD